MSWQSLFVLAALAVSQAEAAAYAPSKASSYAGSTDSSPFPPPGATNTATAAFPDWSQIGYPGPTPTGAEPDTIATAPAYARYNNYYPLIQSEPLVNSSAPARKDFNLMDYWGNMTPLKSLDPGTFGLPDASPQVPEGCSLEQVHLLQRHGARYPQTGGAPSVLAAEIHAAANNGSGFYATGPLAFLNTWEYKLGAETLTAYGREELYDQGVGFRMRYGELLNNFNDIPVFRTTSQSRVYESAMNWAAGFFGAVEFQTSYHQSIIIEENGFNNSLASYVSCANANTQSIGYPGLPLISEYENIYLADTVKRLQQYVTGLELNVSMVYAFQQICSYETVAVGWSPFCSLFTEEEWIGFQYTFDQYFWYNAAFGSPIGAAQGIGYVQELISRLDKTPIPVYNSTTNSTLDSNPTTFPLNQPIYADFSHDVVIANILTAMNFTFLAAQGPLPADRIPENQTFFTNQIVMYASNLVGQVMSCGSETPNKIRFFLNDAGLPLTGVKGCEEKDKNGFCDLSAFVSGMKERTASIDYGYLCNANYTVPLNLTNGHL